MRCSVAAHRTRHARPPAMAFLSMWAWLGEVRLTTPLPLPMSGSAMVGEGQVAVHTYMPHTYMPRALRAPSLIGLVAKG